MTIFNSIPTDAVLVAIDIAKVRNEVLIEAPGYKRRRRLLVLNNRAEHDRLIAVLQAYSRPGFAQMAGWSCRAAHTSCARTCCS